MNCTIYILQMQHVNWEVQTLSWEDSHIYSSAVGLAGSFISSDTEQLQKMLHMLVLFCLCWCFQIGVFGESLSVTEGDSVTLHIGVTEIHEDDDILWKFGAEKSQIAKIKKKKQNFSIYDDVLDGRFRDKLKLDNQTGSLTITNITTQHTGDYQLEMSGAKKSSKTFSVSVYGEQRSGVGSTGP
uniref:Immunoglobulin domain-containing protein n=1 Tax=Cyprinus carpio TaxID=7962 RepID=A0A8C2CF02_CYPCA